MEKLTKEFYRKLNEEMKEQGKSIVVKEVQYGNLSTFSYIHGGLDFSDRRLRLARGLTLDENDKVVLVGFEKFFCNYQLDNRDWLSEKFKEEYSRLQYKEIYECIEKLDGTMVILGVYKNELITSTTSSINNEFSNLALDYFNQLSFKEDLKEYLKERNSCMVFEYISPTNQIAVKYEETDFVLLAEISKDTCEEVKIDNDFNFTRPHILYYTLEELKDIQENSEEIEGFVVFNDYGKRIKIKTDWWYKAKAPTTMFFSNKLTKANVLEILKAYLGDYLDELYSIQNSNQRYKEIDKVGTVENWIKESLEEAYKISKKYTTIREYMNSEDYTKGNSLNKLILCQIEKGELNEKILKQALFSKLKEETIVK